MSKVAVIGLSNFGYYLSLRLSELGSDVLAIDKNEGTIDRIKAYVSRAVIADATDKRALYELGIKDMDSVVLSLGNKLETSILASLHLKELGAKNIVAKSLSEEHTKILEILGVQRIVFPEQEIAYRLATSIHGSNIVDYLPLGSNLSIIEMLPTKEMLGKTLEELDFRKKYHCHVIAIRNRDQKETAFIPDPQNKIMQNQALVVIGKNQDLEKIQ